VFYGLSAFFADLLVVLGPLVILGAEAPRISDWLTRRRLDPLLNPALIEGAAAPQLPDVNTAGLLDEATTERVRMSEWLRNELASTPKSSVAKSEPVLVGGSSVDIPRPKGRAQRP
jgi:hypothetical protein